VISKDYLNRHALKLMVVGFAIGLLAVFGTVGAYSVFESPEFCGYCHAMKAEHATWEKGLHRNVDCVECHLPNDNLAHHLVAKAETGMVDVYHETKRDYPANIEITEQGKQYVNDNCFRCHEVTNDKVHQSLGETKNCIKCHQDVAHGQDHLEGGTNLEVK
jgi:putative cytochrome c nitrite reductase, small subunit nrfH